MIKWLAVTIILQQIHIIKLKDHELIMIFSIIVIS